MIERIDDCITCKGTGETFTIFQTKISCPACQGTGKVKILVPDEIPNDE